MTMKYGQDPITENLYAGEDITINPGDNELTEAEFNDAVATQIADAQAANAAVRAAMASDAADTAQAVYDEIHVIHPVTALALARVIDPTFTP